LVVLSKKGKGRTGAAPIWRGGKVFQRERTEKGQKDGSKGKRTGPPRLRKEKRFLSLYKCKRKKGEKSFE